MKMSAPGKSWFSLVALAAVAGVAFLGLIWLRQKSAPEEAIVGGAFGRAAAIYQRQCSTCHGREGFGDGKAAYLIHPRPRDFSYGKFLLVSTDNRAPTDDDLFNTITRGMPGSAMPPWEHLPEQDRRDLVRYVRALTHRGKVLRLMGLRRGPVAAGHQEEIRSQPLAPEEAEEVATDLLTVGQPLEPPVQVPPAESLIDRGREIYLGNCAKCHGREGKGDGSEVMEDDLGFRTSPRDFTKGIFKGGTELEQLAYRVLGGMPGSAMPSTDFDSGEDLWAVVHYVRSLIDPGAQERVQQRRQRILATRAAQSINDDPLSPSWNAIQPIHVGLMPLWWRDGRVETVHVRATHDGQNLAVHLSWEDPVQDVNQLHITAFGDAAAVQFSSEDDPPFFGMGDPAGMVNIWHWKAVWEEDRPSFKDITSAYPRAIMDFDMSLKRIQPSSAPNVTAKIEDRDPNFYSGWGAGNLVSTPERPSPIEDLNAQGLGTVHSQALSNQSVRGKGSWRDGVWQVVFVRPMSASSAGNIEFQPGRAVRIAFAIWDGKPGDRDGQKSVTIWHDLSLEE